MEYSKKSNKSYNSLSQAISSQAQTPNNQGSLLHVEDNPEQYYVHSNPRHCGMFYEHIFDNLQFAVPLTLKEVNLRTFNKNKITDIIKNDLYEANPTVIRSIIDTSRFLWMIETLLQMQIKAIKGFLLGLFAIVLMLIVEIFVNLSEISDYYIGYIVLGSISLLSIPLVCQKGIISFILIVLYQLLMLGSIFYLCIFSQNFTPSKNDFIFLIAYSLAFIVQLYFFFYFEVKRRLLCYLLHHTIPE